MSDRDERLHRWYTLHAGVVPMSQLVEFGFTERNVYRMVERNELIILQPGVFQSSQYRPVICSGGSRLVCATSM